MQQNARLMTWLFLFNMFSMFMGYTDINLVPNFLLLYQWINSRSVSTDVFINRAINQYIYKKC